MLFFYVMSEFSFGEAIPPSSHDVGELLHQHDSDPYGYLAHATMIYDWGIEAAARFGSKREAEMLDGLHAEVALAGARLGDSVLFNTGWQGIQQPLTKWRVYAEAISSGAGIVTDNTHLDDLTTILHDYESTRDCYALACIETAKLRMNVTGAPATTYERHELDEQLRITTSLITQHGVGSHDQDRVTQADQLRYDLANVLLEKGLFDDAAEIISGAQNVRLGRIIAEDILLHTFVPLAEAGKFKPRAWRKELERQKIDRKSGQALSQVVSAFLAGSTEAPRHHVGWVREYRPARYGAWYATDNRGSSKEALLHMSTLLKAGYISQARDQYYYSIFTKGQPWEFDEPGPYFAMSTLLAQHDTARPDPTIIGDSVQLELGMAALRSAAYYDVPSLYGGMVSATTHALTKIQAMPHSSARIVAALELAAIQPTQEGQPIRDPVLIQELERSLTVLTRLSRSRNERLPASLKPLFKSFGMLPFKIRVDTSREILAVFESAEADNIEHHLPNTDF